MRLLLDEMWDHEIAAQLRHRRHDVVAATEAEHADRLRGAPDNLVFERAQEDRRAIVTDNIGDYEPIRLDYQRRRQPHHGVIYALSPPFDRHRGKAVIGQMVKALDRLLRSLPGDHEPFNTAHWLQSG